jgi:hypothetical protein
MKDYCVIVANGNNDLFESYIPKSYNNYDLKVIFYNIDGFDKYKNDTRFDSYYIKGKKFDIIKHLIKNAPDIKEYKYTMCLDDDMLIHRNSVDKYFDLCNQYNAIIAHPAVGRLNNNMPYLQANQYTKYRVLNHCELMAVTFSKYALNVLYKTFDVNNSGYGYPELWKKLINEQNIYMLIDDVEVLHTRPFGEGAETIYDNGIEGACAELQQLYADYDIEPAIPKVAYSIWKQPLLSVIINYCDSDEYHLKHCIETLPKWPDVEYIIAYHDPNLFDDDIEYEVYETEKADKITKLSFKANPDTFDFSKARNIALNEASGRFVLQIDPDERFPVYKHKALRNLLEKYAHDYNIGGFVTWNTGAILDADANGMDDSIAKISGTPQMRLFRNRPDVRFKSQVHESTGFDIERLNLEYKYTDIVIIHEGYIANKEKQSKKLLRNIKAGIRNGDFTLGNEQLLEHHIYACYYYLSLIKDY